MTAAAAAAAATAAAAAAAAESCQVCPQEHQGVLRITKVRWKINRRMVPKTGHLGYVCPAADILERHSTKQPGLTSSWLPAAAGWATAAAAAAVAAVDVLFVLLRQQQCVTPKLHLLSSKRI
jgi:hypothetical protein